MQHEVTTHQLEGNAQILFINVPNALSFHSTAVTRSGFRFAEPEKFELPHILEHMFAEGNKDYPDPHFFKATVEKLGAYRNAYTDPNNSGYVFAAARDNLDDVLQLLGGYVFKPLFDIQRLEQQKGTIAAELSRYIDNDVSNRFYFTSQAIYDNFPLSWEGRIKSLEHITKKDLEDYYRTYYGSQNMFFVFSGAFNNTAQKKVISALNHFLQIHSRGRMVDYRPHKLLNYGRLIQTFESKKDSISNFRMDFVVPGYHDDPGLSLLTSMFAGGGSSRMQFKGREQGLTYTFSAGRYRQHEYTSFFLADQTQPKKLLPLFELALAELADIAKGNFTDNELARAQGFMGGNIYRSTETAAQLGKWYLDDFVAGRSLISPTEWLSIRQAVTRQDVLGAAQKYIKKDNWVLTLIGRGLEENKKQYADIINSYFA